MAKVFPSRSANSSGRRKPQWLGSKGKSSAASSNEDAEDTVDTQEDMELDILSGVFSSSGGKEYQEDMAVKIDDFNDVIKKEAKKNFTGDWGLHRGFYAVYDGHGGVRCSKFLAEHFHVMLAKHPLLGEQPEKAIDQVWAHVEERFLDVCTRKYEKSKSDGQPSTFHNSGSTATIALIVGNTMYTANCGDSHAYLYCARKHPKRISDDHNTDNPEECARVRRSGAKVEQDTIMVRKSCFSYEKVEVGKLRVWPGGLAVTRSFGDYASKLEAFGGVKDSVLSEYSELRTIQLDPNKHLGVVLASDGVWDAMKGTDVWDACKSGMANCRVQDPFEKVTNAAQNVVTSAVTSTFWEKERCSPDNATAIVLLLSAESMFPTSDDAESGPHTSSNVASTTSDKLDVHKHGCSAEQAQLAEAPSSRLHDRLGNKPTVTTTGSSQSLATDARTSSSRRKARHSAEGADCNEDSLAADEPIRTTDDEPASPPILKTEKSMSKVRRKYSSEVKTVTFASDVR